jgi:signal transduction histidine kinase
MDPVDPPLHALIEQAWLAHHREPAQLLPLGEQIVERAIAEHDETARAWGFLHQAWGLRFLARTEEAAGALQRAETAFAVLDDASGLAACRDLRAMTLGLARRTDEAVALLALNDTRAHGPRRARERFITHQRRAWLHDTLGERDASLRERYAMLAAAQESGDGAARALALGLLGGVHADLYNLDEAEQLCREAMALAETHDAGYAWTMAALNGMNALVAQGRGADALPWAQALMAREPKLNPRAREQRLIVYADAFAQAGSPERAQALLDESRQRRHAGSESLLSWTTAQAVTWAAAGQWQALRELAEAWLQEPRHGTDPAQVPSEQLRLLQLASRACEALGDAAAALHWAREAFVLHEKLVGRSARARRLALEVEHGLAMERARRQQAEQAQQRLDALNRALEEASAAKTRFLAAASHDLRQPVQALALNMAALEIESRSATTSAQHDLVQRMSASLQALTQMFEVLLDISRLDAGLVPVTREPVALAPLLERLHHELSGTAAGRGLRLRLRLPRARSATDNAPEAFTQSDPVLLERCLRNLLDNALKYTQRGGVLLALRHHAGGWQLSVTDSGIGMAPEVLARACEEFFQAANPERDRRHGLGLGLAIVQRTLGLLGHPLTLASRLDHGTRVCVQIEALRPSLPGPAARLTAAPSGAPSGAPSSTPFGTHDGAPAAAGLVLVVDDDAAVREALAALLQRWGHAVLHAGDDSTVLENWRTAGRPPVQALITDWRLACHRTGAEVVQSLRQSLGTALPALVITGDIAPDRLAPLLASGLPWLAKPVMPLRLRSWLTATTPAQAPTQTAAQAQA